MKCKSCKDEIKVMCRLGTKFCSTNCEKQHAAKKNPDREFAIAS